MPGKTGPSKQAGHSALAETSTLGIKREVYTSALHCASFHFTSGGEIVVGSAEGFRSSVCLTCTQVRELYEDDASTRAAATYTKFIYYERWWTTDSRGIQGAIAAASKEIQSHSRSSTSAACIQAYPRWTALSHIVQNRANSTAFA